MDGIFTYFNHYILLVKGKTSIWMVHIYPSLLNAFPRLKPDLKPASPH